jgi:hypothetical protein
MTTVFLCYDPFLWININLVKVELGLKSNMLQFDLKLYITSSYCEVEALTNLELKDRSTATLMV